MHIRSSACNYPLSCDSIKLFLFKSRVFANTNTYMSQNETLYLRQQVTLYNRTL